MTKEHEVLLPTRAVLAVKESNKRAFNRRQLAIAFLAISAAFFVWIRPVVYPGQKTGTVMIGTAGFTGYHCDQVPALVPDSSRLNDSQLFSPEFAATAAKRLSQAVQIPTVSFDNMTDLAPTVPDASVHLPFLRFHTFLENAFPLVHKHLLRRVINKYSLLYSWKGTNHYAAPLILMAHIDVVPVLPETANLWTHDPFSGYIDHENGFLWGRGAGDTKATVLGTLEAVEALLKATNGKYLPNSDIYLAFGHDEEISGYQGAKSIADYLQHDLGLAGKVGLIVDEGPGFGEVNDVRLATVGTGEKGYVDASITVETKGGHSSVPPKHTGIGYTALAIAALESKVYPINLSDNNPILGSTRCYAQHSKKVDPFIQWAIENLNNGGRQLLAAKLSDRDLRTAALLTTTQATDIIYGGLKVNALPEKVTAIVNHRIAVDSSLAATQKHITEVLLSVAKENKLSLTVNQFDDPEKIAFEYSIAEALGKISVSPAFGKGLEPAPSSPANGDGSIGWSILEGTIHYVFDEDSQIIVSPSMSSGNTDTRHYWGLSKSIYRFAPTGGINAHTVDEHIELKKYIKAIKFYHSLIRNWNE